MMQRNHWKKIQYDPSCKKDDCPPSSFPAKLTQVLYHRYQSGKKGIIMVKIDNNRELLNNGNWKMASKSM